MAIISSLLVSAVSAETHFYTKHDKVIGSIHAYKVKKGESLIEIARKFDIGYSEITEANPKLDPFVPGEGVTIKLPQAWILPDHNTSLGDEALLFSPAKQSCYVSHWSRERRQRDTRRHLQDSGENSPSGLVCTRFHKA
jgi:LysM repeat protein